MSIKYHSFINEINTTASLKVTYTPYRVCSEINEETNVDATFVEGFMENVEYKKEMHIMKHVTYFLATYENQEVRNKEKEIMKLFLLPYKQALSKVTYNNSKELLQKAVDYIGKNNIK